MSLSLIPEIKSLVETYLNKEDQNIQDQIDTIESDKNIADLLTPLSVGHLKGMLGITAILKMIVDNPNFLTSLNFLFDKK